MATRELFTLRELQPDDWQLLAEIRLASLTDSPRAFASTIERERAFDEETWRSRLSSSNYFVALCDEEPCGIVCLLRNSEHAPPGSHIVSMWVSPAWRRRGVARALVEKALSFASSEGDKEVNLWVAEANEGAIRAYQQMGFLLTGDAQPFPTRPEDTELLMRFACS